MPSSNGSTTCHPLKLYKDGTCIGQATDTYHLIGQDDHAIILNGKLLYEGELLNGKINGKGKIYYNGELIFEGVFLDGKKWKGKGKEYQNGEIIFEGEFLEGK